MKPRTAGIYGAIFVSMLLIGGCDREAAALKECYEAKYAWAYTRDKFLASPHDGMGSKNSWLEANLAAKHWHDKVCPKSL